MTSSSWGSDRSLISFFPPFFPPLAPEAFHNLMEKGPAVIRLTEHWKCRQNKRLEITDVLQAGTARSCGLSHDSPRFWEYLYTGVCRPWVLLQLGAAGSGIHTELLYPLGQTHLSLLLPCCAHGAGREGDAHRLTQWQCTSCQVSLIWPALKRKSYFSKLSIMPHKTLNPSKSGRDSLAWCPRSCLT